MANKFVSLLQHVGKDLEKGLSIILPLAQVAAPELAAIDPALGAVFSTTLGVVVQTEQKFAAMGKQNGTGTQKFSEALSILSPIVTSQFAAAGKAHDADTVSKYVQAVVDFLNAIPATLQAPATPAPATA